MSTPLTLEATAGAGFERALSVFRRAARHVPAYADFLARHGIDPANIRSPEDFRAVPPMTKPDYLRHYPLPMLLWHGDVGQAGTWSCSSGATGRPSYWPRDTRAHEDAVDLYARVLGEQFHTRWRSTLLVVGFAMGDWIGGTYTYAAALALRARGHRLSVAAPGIEREAILADIADLGPHYDQVVLAGYPPFVKDVLDHASPRVLRQDLRLLLAGEAITEQWRDHVLDRLGAPGAAEMIRVVYGTADAGVLGHETHTSVAVRRAAAADAGLSRALFGDDHARPTFVEYDADRRFTETDPQGRLLFSVDTAIPLLRYRINDVGRVFTAAELADVLAAHGYSLPVRTSTDSCGFLALHRRADIAASFYAVKIYPDDLRAALEDPDVSGVVTGKFVLTTETDAHFDQTLRLRVELREGACPAATFATLLTGKVVDSLRRANSEYRRLHGAVGAAAVPMVTLGPHGSAGFETGVKHRWTET